jgi:predicted nucleotidyltransferase
MYKPEEREIYFKQTIEKLQSLPVIEGIIQLGSGVNGYKDEHSDIDLMVSTYKKENLQAAKDYIHQSLIDFKPICIKEKQFTTDIYLLIVILENTLEFNISILPSERLNVKSPLWKVIVDKSGVVSKKMNIESERFNNKPIKYNLYQDPAFEFVYSALRLNKELQRNNMIYALKMLETMMEYTLQVQALNENKKFHQFKAYDSLDPSFIKAYLSTYPEEISVKHIAASADKLKDLFVETIQQSSVYSIENNLYQLLNRVICLT